MTELCANPCSVDMVFKAKGSTLLRTYFPRYKYKQQTKQQNNKETQFQYPIQQIIPVSHRLHLSQAVKK